MNTLGIVALSLLLGAFIVCLIAMAGYLAYDGYRLRKLLDSAVAANQATIHDLSLLRNEIGTTLESHRIAMEASVGKINGEKLQTASLEAINAARRIETAAIAIGELARALLSEDALQATRETNLAPEAFAPETGERHIGYGRTAAQDRAELAGEGEGGE